MKTTSFITVLFVGIFAITSFQGLSQSNDIVLTIENDKVTRDDFEAVFRKNNRDSLVTKASLDEYMELYINFKLKVREAMEEGLDTARSFQRELAGYRKQLARPYLVDTELLEELTQEAYQRKQFEVRASHILIKVDPSASPQDTLRAYERIMKLRDRILAGEDFATVATSKGGSEDPSVRENKGDLGYFTAFNMVYPFESAAFNTAVGEISMPVRTRFGYHIVKTLDKRAARGEIKVAHIMLRHKDSSKVEANAEVEARIREIHQMLKDGADFGELAMRYSDDASSARSGGELPWFGTGKMVEPFENGSFALENDGDISEPVRSNYGWHIIKRLEYKGVPDFEASRNEIEKKVGRDSRAEITRKSFLDKLKKAYGVSINAKTLKPLYKAAKKDDSTFVAGRGIKVKKEKALNKTLFSIDGQDYQLRSFYDYLNNSGIRRRGEEANVLIDQQLNTFVDRELMTYEDSQLEKKHNEFRLLMSEYHDGILLFELTDRKVWSRAVKDSAGLADFYDANKERFMWNERLSATVFTCADEAAAKEVERMLKREKTPIEIKEALNKKSALNVRIEEGTWERGEREYLDALEWKENAVVRGERNGEILVVAMSEVIPATPKKLDEARGMITAEYQNHLEAEWIKALREKYSFKVNREVLHSIR